MKKLFLILLFLTSISLLNLVWKTTKPSVISWTSTLTESISTPKKLIIPKLSIEASIEHVAKDKAGNMDVPKQWDTTAWYKLGAKPGQVGQAVIAGHYDSDTGPAIFVNLDQLLPGDTVYVVDSVGRRLKFVVEKVERYPGNQFPIPTVFGTSTQARLNLITCSGQFNNQSQEYSHRIVVFTRLDQ